MITSETAHDAAITPSALVEAGNISVSHNHQVARELAAAGIAVFPCNSKPNTKKLPHHMPDKGPLSGVIWPKAATTNQTNIDNWWRNHPEALVGIPAKQTGLFIVDADRHPDKPDGLTAFEKLIAVNGGLPDGVVIIDTQSGGRHFVFKQPAGLVLGNSSGRLPDEVDTRGASGDGGYFIAPGTIWISPDGELRQWHETKDSPSLREAFTSNTIPEVPQWIISIINQPKKVAATNSLMGPQRGGPLSAQINQNIRQEDSRHTPHAGNHIDTIGLGSWLEQAKIAEDFERISTAIFHVSSAPRETWLSYGGALHDRFGESGRVLWDEWSKTSGEKYDPIEQDKTWRSFSRDYSGKRTTIASIIYDARAAGYIDASLPSAASGQESNFYNKEEVLDKNIGEANCAGTTVNPKTPSLFRSRLFINPGADQIPRRRPIYGGHYIRKYTSLDIAPGGVGKSSLVIAEALAIASGRPLLGFTPDEQVNVQYCNLEDPYEELQRRFIAAIQYYELDPSVLEGRLFVNSGRDSPFMIAAQARDGLVIAEALGSGLID